VVDQNLERMKVMCGLYKVLKEIYIIGDDQNRKLTFLKILKKLRFAKKKAEEVLKGQWPSLLALLL
jgi:hypothetical protein